MIFQEKHYEILWNKYSYLFTIFTIKINNWILKNEPIIHNKCVLLILELQPPKESLS